MRTLKTMKAKNIFGFFAATIVLAVLLMMPVYAFATINEVIVNGIEFEDFNPAPTAAVFAGEVEDKTN